jgi:ubiquinone/menaquinone biosynthesis C-methylase UbiE
VREASVTDIPFPDETFDVACSFKVLAHVEAIERALSEMARVTRPGGVILAELYNPISLRGLAKRLGPAGHVSSATTEDAVYTRFDVPWRLAHIIPQGTQVEARWGVRIVTPVAAALRVPGLRAILSRLEHRLAPTPAAFLAGFHVVILRKR